MSRRSGSSATSAPPEARSSQWSTPPRAAGRSGRAGHGACAAARSRGVSETPPWVSFPRSRLEGSREERAPWPSPHRIREMSLVPREEVTDTGRPGSPPSRCVGRTGGGIDGNRAHREVREARSRARAAGDRAIRGGEAGTSKSSTRRGSSPTTSRTSTEAAIWRRKPGSGSSRETGTTFGTDRRAGGGGIKLAAEFALTH